MERPGNGIACYHAKMDIRVGFCTTCQISFLLFPGGLSLFKLKD